MIRSFDRVLLARHFALSLGAVAAYVFRSELRIGYVVLWIVGISASLNFLAYLFQTRESLAKLCAVASPLIGVGGWTALVGVTNGTASPFIAGLWLEIVLSAMALRLQGVAAVTGLTLAGLWGQQLYFGLEGRLLPMILQSGFLLGMGLATYLVTRRWTLTQAGLARVSAELGERLDELTRQLEDERVVAELGENVARLAHGLKNAVHSLRGFVGLIEPKLAGQSGSGAALTGLRNAIDDLERLAHLTLGSSSRSGGEDAAASASLLRSSRLRAGVARAQAEIEAAHPGVVWESRNDGHSPLLPLSESTLVELLVILMRNAVEAMDGCGHACVETGASDGEARVSVSDEGVGVVPEDVSLLFKPGYTTKPGGSGYGLFLARRLVEEHGGRLEARPRSSGGLCVELTLPAVVEVGDSV